MERKRRMRGLKQLYEQRQKLQKQITYLCKKAIMTQKQSIMQKILEAWKQATEYLKKNHHRITYATTSMQTHKNTKKERKKTDQTNQRLRGHNKNKWNAAMYKKQNHRIHPHQIHTKQNQNIQGQWAKKKNLQQKLQTHGEICALQNRWDIRKLKEETKNNGSSRKT